MALNRHARVAIVAAIGLVVVLALSFVLLALQAGSAVARIAEALAPEYTLAYSAPRVSFSGDLSVRQLTLTPRGEGRATLAAKHATLSPPGAGWFIAAAFGSGPRLPALDEVRIVLDGVSVEGGGELHPALRWLGARSAAPFEGAGCGPSIRLGVEDWRGLGLGAGEARLEAAYAVTGPGLGTITARYEVPGSSSAVHRRVLKLADPERPLPLDPARAATVESQWTIVDDGFVAARSRQCARRARVSRASFANAHVAAVRTWLQRHRLVPDESLVAAYTAYAARGGELSFASRPRAPIPVTSDVAPAVAMQRLGATLTAGGRSVPFSFVAAESVPIDDAIVAGAIPGGSPTGSAAERAAAGEGDAAATDDPSGTATPAPLASTTPADTPPPAAATDAATDAASKPPGAAAPQPAAPATVASATTTAPKPAAEPPAARAPAATTPPPAVATKTPAAPAQPAPAASTPPAPPTSVPARGAGTPASVASTVPAPSGAAAAKPSPAHPARAVPSGPAAYDALEHAVGRRLAVRTIHDSRRTGVLRDWNGQAITLELPAQEGGFLLKIPKDEIVRAEVVGTQVAPPRDHAEKN